MAALGRFIRRVDASGVPLLAARLLVGGLFAYLAYRKLLDPFEFLKQIRAYGVFPERPPQIINSLAAVLPWLELTCAAALLLGVLVRGAALTIFGMLTAFGPLLVWRAWTEYQAPGSPFPSFCAVRFDCGCGTGEVYICWKMLENTAAQLGALIALLSRSRFLCLSALLTRRRAPRITTSP